MTVFLLGDSGAGKTCFLSALHYEFATQKRAGLFLQPNTDRQNHLFELGKWDTLHIGNGQLPAGTLEIKVWELLLTRLGRTLAELSFMDVRGGVFGESLTAASDEIEHLKVYLSNAEVIVAFIDGGTVARYPEPERIRNAADVRVLNHFLTYLAKHSQERSVSVYFVVTKADLLPERLVANCFAELNALVAQAFAYELDLIAQHRWRSYQAAYSAFGRGRAQTDVLIAASAQPGNLPSRVQTRATLTDIPRPYFAANILAQMVRDHLSDQVELLSPRIEEKSALIERLRGKNTFSALLARVTGGRNPHEAAQLLSVERDADLDTLRAAKGDLDYLQRELPYSYPPF